MGGGQHLLVWCRPEDVACLGAMLDMCRASLLPPASHPCRVYILCSHQSCGTCRRVHFFTPLPGICWKHRSRQVASGSVQLLRRAFSDHSHRLHLHCTPTRPLCGLSVPWILETTPCPLASAVLLAGSPQSLSMSLLLRPGNFCPVAVPCCSSCANVVLTTRVCPCCDLIEGRVSLPSPPAPWHARLQPCTEEQVRLGLQ